MAEITANGVRLYHELRGGGEPMALVHGSWSDATSFARVASALAGSFRVLTYDRRGHSRSERPATQGSVDEDGDDLAALLEALGMAPAHVVTSSFGGNIGLRLALRRPELFRSLTCHEPPLWGLLTGDPDAGAMLERGRRSLEGVVAAIAAGDHEGGARRFVEEIAFGPGAWDGLPPDVRAIFVGNAPTFLDEARDPTQVAIDADALRALGVPVCVTQGTESPPAFGRVVDRLAELLPDARRELIEGAAHVPHLTHPDEHVRTVRRAVLRVAA